MNGDGVGEGSAVQLGRFATTAYDRLRILERYRRVGMVGLSSNPFRPSHFAAIYLLAEGYDIVPVNPRETEVLGRRCYPSLCEIPGGVEIVDIFRANIVDVSFDSVTVEVTGDEDKVDSLTNLLRAFGIKELARTGRIAMTRGGSIPPMTDKETRENHNHAKKEKA